MKLSAVLLAMLCVGASSPAYSSGQAGIDLHSDDWQRRFEALQKVVGSPAARNDRTTQNDLIELLDRESQDPNWAGKQEFPVYEKYYGCLLEVVETIADTTHNSRAWIALVHANFGDSSRVADSIVGRLESTPYLLDASSEPNAIIQSRAVYMLAKQVARCKQALFKDGCSSLESHVSAILDIVREAAEQSQRPALQLSAIRGLGISGSMKDIALLHRIGNQNPDRWFNLYISRAEKQILDREKTGHP